ncbi:MAG: hypothetical protein HYR49_06080 [Gammaproteobacteria bacterium]|nr:hypothetical protein [Gammaproteobacteria bacterium]
MELHRIGIKVPMQEGLTLPALDFIQVFHQWIQAHTLPGVLIDVADYSHVHHGPGILLITHAGNYSVDEIGGRRGVSYYSKHALPGDLTARLITVCRLALQACDLLEREARFAGKLKFNAGELELFANDRLEAPNTAATETAILPAVKSLLGKLYPGAESTVERDPDTRERFTLRIDSGMQADSAKLLKNVGL